MKGPLKFDDLDLIKLIKKQYLVPPPDESVPYKLHGEGIDATHEYKSLYPSWILINSILEDFYPSEQRGGFFVEAGALDGEYMSNTLRLEMEQGWTGLLVEPDKDNFKLLKEVSRKAWLTPSCLALHNYPESVLLSKMVEIGVEVDWFKKVNSFIVLNNDVPVEDWDPKFLTTLEEAQCLPAQSLLMAINVSHVDFFSLDIEVGDESVLNRFPFDQISVDVWAIEHRREELSQKFENKSLQNYTLGDLKRLGFDEGVIRYREQLISEFEDQRFIKVMLERGYYYFEMSCAFIGDYIFVRKASDLYKKLKVPRNRENRTEICKHKKVHANFGTTYTNNNLRDYHHYPDLQYREH